MVLNMLGHFTNLKHINVGYITWDTLLQIWSLVINLGRNLEPLIYHQETKQPIICTPVLIT